MMDLHTPRLRRLSALALLSLFACRNRAERRAPSATVETERSHGDSARLATSAPDAATTVSDAEPAVADGALGQGARRAVPPLFAAMPCAALIAQRGALGQDAQRLSLGQRPLSQSELYARPWLWGQAGSGCTADDVEPRPTDTPPEVDRGSSAERARVVTRHYLRWSRVDDELRWAPWLCRLPMGASPRADLDPSQSPHGRKVYYLYARNRLEYVSDTSSPTQIVVKEAWRPRETTRQQAVRASMRSQCVGEGDHCVEPGDFAGLYIMMRQPNPAPGERTDDGWTYATVDPQGAVTASGVIESCAGCHRRAPHGRLFGVQHARAPASDSNG